MVQINHNMEQIGRELGQLISRYAKQVERDLDEVMREQAGLLRNDIVTGWPVDSGASRAGWQGPNKVAFANYEVVLDGEGYPYGVVIEFGGYRGVGPKTAHGGPATLPGGIQVGAGIYVTQRPIAPVRQALSKRNVEVRKELPKVLKV